MEREFLATGKTVEEAIEAAYEKAGVDREYVTVEIIERPKKKFFGLKTVPATAKAVIDEDYWNKMVGVKEKKAEAPKKKKEPKEQKPKAEKPVQEQPKKEKQEKPKKEQKPQQPKKQEPKKEIKPAEVKTEEAPKEEVKVLAPEVLEKKGSEAANYIKEVLTALGYPEAEVTYTQKDGMIVLQLSGCRKWAPLLAEEAITLMQCSILLPLLQTKAKEAMSALFLISTITGAREKQAFALTQEKPLPRLLNPDVPSLLKQ